MRLDLLPDSPTRRRAIAYICLAVFVGVGCLTIYRGGGVDEADNLVNGAFISHGYVLYKDVFSHHFPFPYYFMAVIVSIFGKSLFAARVSLLLFQCLAFAISMSYAGYPSSLSMAAVAWALLRPLYWGNMVIYSSFTGAALLVVFVIVGATLQSRSVLGFKISIVLAVFSLIAVLAEPLAIYAVLVAHLLLMLRQPKDSIVALAILVIGIGFFFGYLVISDSWPAFWKDVVVFNSQIYSKYADTNPLKLQEFWIGLTSALGIAEVNPISYDPFMPLSYSSVINDWFFTGALYRIALITGSVLALIRKEWLAAASLFAYSAAVLLISSRDFHAQAFVLVSLASMSAVIFGKWEKMPRALVPIRFGAALVLGAAMIWLLYRSATFVFIDQQSALSYEATLAGDEADARKVADLSCGQTSAHLAYYPGGTYAYWFTDLRPVSQYTFMWPWIAKAGLSDVISALNEPRVLAIVARYDTVVAGQDTREYLAPLDAFLKDNYLLAADSVYVSPELLSRCISQETQSGKKWSPTQVIEAFTSAHLEAADPHALTKEDYGNVPPVDVSSVRFLLPSLGGNKGGRVYAFAAEEDLEKVKYYYAHTTDTAIPPWILVKDNILVQLNGELLGEQVLHYRYALNEMK